MTNKLLLSTLVLLVANGAIANSDQQKIEARLNDQRIQDETRPILPTQQKPAPQAVKKSPENANRISMTKAELAQQPDLVIRALIPAVMQGNLDNVALLFPIYQQIPAQYQDPLLTLWSEAILAKQKQQHTQAIKAYRELLAAKSDLLPARLQLAVTLFENSELEAAEDQFQKLRAETLPAELQGVISQYLNAIAQRDRWTFGGGFTYLNDPNINNAPKSGTTYGNWIAPKSESAQGVGFNFDIGKKWSWGNGFFNELSLNTNGKYYWNNKKYNEVSVRGGLGIGYQNAKMLLSVAPFLEQTLYAGGSSEHDSLKRFSKSGGVSGDLNYWLSDKWQYNLNYEYGEQRYTRRQHLDGNYHFVSTGLVYYPNAQRRFFANLNYNRTSTVTKDDSFFRRGVTLGWLEEWSKGLSTRLSVSFAQKQYKAPMPIFNLTQRNREYGVQASVWHRAIHYWGITPRLTYSFNKTRSNHPFYSYDKHRVFIDFSKQF